MPITVIVLHVNTDLSSLEDLVTLADRKTCHDLARAGNGLKMDLLPFKTFRSEQTVSICTAEEIGIENHLNQLGFVGDIENIH